MRVKTAETLEKREIEALVSFWRRFLPARQRYYRDHDKPDAGYGWWLQFKETKEQLFRELAAAIPDVRYTHTWRYIQDLNPEGLVSDILAHRKEKQSKREAQNVSN